LACAERCLVAAADTGLQVEQERSVCRLQIFTSHHLADSRARAFSAAL